MLKRCAVAVGVILSAAACGGGQATTTGSQNLASVHIQVYPGTIVSLMSYAASSEGFFKQNGIDATLVPIPGSTAGQAALTTGNIDLMVTSPGNFLPSIADALKGQGKGFQAIVVAGQLYIEFELVARNDITSVSQLKGKTIGIYGGLNSNTHLIAKAIVAQAGLSPNDVRYVGTTTPAATFAAMDRGDIQAAMTFDPAAYQIVKAGDGHVLVDLRTSKELPAYLQGVQFAGMWATPAYIKGHATEIAGVRRAEAQADIWVHDPKNLAAVEKLMSAQMGDTVSAGDLADFTKSNLRLMTAAYSADSMAAWIAFDVATGYLDTPIPLSSAWASGTPQNQHDVEVLAKS